MPNTYPKCSCGDPLLPGHLTCDSAECEERREAKTTQSAEDTGLAVYRWKITKDHIDDGEAKGAEGPSLHNPNINDNRQHFVMKDDDGTTYYEGEIWGEYSGFEPLDDFGTPNAGCTRIFYKGEEL